MFPARPSHGASPSSGSRRCARAPGAWSPRSLAFAPAPGAWSQRSRAFGPAPGAGAGPAARLWSLEPGWSPDRPVSLAPGGRWVLRRPLGTPPAVCQITKSVSQLVLLDSTLNAALIDSYPRDVSGTSCGAWRPQHMRWSPGAHGAGPSDWLLDLEPGLRPGSGAWSPPEPALRAGSWSLEPMEPGLRPGSIHGAWSQRAPCAGLSIITESTKLLTTG